MRTNSEDIGRVRKLTKKLQGSGRKISQILASRIFQRLLDAKSRQRKINSSEFGLGSISHQTCAQFMLTAAAVGSQEYIVLLHHT
jgi:hypothetical protein